MRLFSTLSLCLTMLFVTPVFLKAQNANVSDSLALVDFYNSTNGAGWANASNWLAGPVNTWYGITLNANGNVTGIVLNANNLAGPIPSSIGNLKKVTNIALSNNRLTGSIPPSLFNDAFSPLTKLDLSNNLLSGQIPASVGTIGFNTLNLSNNQLSGLIPYSLSNLSYTYSINLSHNQFTGNIPVSPLGSYQWTRIFDVSYNHLSGTFPSGLSGLDSLGLNTLPNDPDSWTPTPIIAFNVNNNNYTFAGLIPFAFRFGTGNNTHYGPQDTVLPILKSNGKLYVSAADDDSGPLTVYSWYRNDTLVAQINGDPVYTPAADGKYYVIVTNTVATQLTLYSDTITLSSVMPVNITRFSGDVSHNNSLLSWQTATEVNTAYFNVQRSIDGIVFTTVGKLNAAVNSNTALNYSYTDANAFVTNNVLFYRLQEVDKDGHITLSSIIKLGDNNGNGRSMIVYPNPVHNQLTVKMANVAGSAVIAVTGIDGKKLITQQVGNVANGTTVTVNTASLPEGMYVLQVLYKGKTITEKFIKQ